MATLYPARRPEGVTRAWFRARLSFCPSDVFSNLASLRFVLVGRGICVHLRPFFGWVGGPESPAPSPESRVPNPVRTIARGSTPGLQIGISPPEQVFRLSPFAFSGWAEGSSIFNVQSAGRSRPLTFSPSLPLTLGGCVGGFSHFTFNISHFPVGWVEFSICNFQFSIYL